MNQLIENYIAPFFLTPASAKPLAALRVGISFVLLLQAYMLKDDFINLVSSTGYLQEALSHYNHANTFFRLSTLIAGLTKISAMLSAKFATNIEWSELGTIKTLCGIYLVSLVGLIAGFKTRWSGFIAWITHGILMNSSVASIYGVDFFAQVYLFYLFVFPSGSSWSLDQIIAKTGNDQVSWFNRLGLRTMQIHACIAYLATGIEKSLGIQWWNGEVMLRVSQLPIYQPIHRIFAVEWIHQVPALSFVAGWITLILEVGYIVFIWPESTRRLWVLGVIGLHLGIIFFMGLTTFGLFMAILTPCLFLISPEQKNRATA